MYVSENERLRILRVEKQGVLETQALRRASGTNRKMFSHWEGGFPTKKELGILQVKKLE
jgi:hypothetical protein